MNTAQSAAPEDILYPTAIPFVLLHVAAFGAVWTGVGWSALGLCGGLYLLRMFGVTAGYHRYFSHRSFSTGRAFQFVLAVLAQSSAQKSVLWWASKHRHHHRHSDTAEDVHSPRQKGFVYSHLGWIFYRRHDIADLSTVPDLTAFPELSWLHRRENVPTLLLALLCLLFGGWRGLVVGYVWSTLLVYHATFAINSFAHVVGRRRYVTGDDSRNNFLLALATLGEGWHNNHHAFQSSARQGFRWWEIDLTYYALKGLALCGIVDDLKDPPKGVLANQQRLGTTVLQRTAEQLAARFCHATIVRRMREQLSEADLVSLQAEMITVAAPGVTQFYPHFPSREAFVAEARRLFARTPSLNEIVDRAQHVLAVAIGRSLVSVGGKVP